MNDYNYPLVWIIIGVSGSGKTTIGRRLSQWMECQYIEGDRIHSKQNIVKMIERQPLEDEHRHQWLAEIERDIREAIDRKREVVITCSALKVKYRKQLKVSELVKLVWIDLPTEILKKRQEARANHFMFVTQEFEAIQPDEEIISINGNQSINDVMNEVKIKIIRQFPDMRKPWWERGLD